MILLIIIQIVMFHAAAFNNLQNIYFLFEALFKSPVSVIYRRSPAEVASLF